ncbi:MAG: MATE family efflux transporter [Gemmatimonadales bacterium]|nr:MATE family efflux transporter [Gemmatimonadales bacterium]
MLRPTRADIRSLLALATPIATVQVGLMFMGVVDTAMVGRFSAEALAATGAANIWFFMVTTIGMGCIAALAPVIAQAYGAHDDLGVTRGVQRGFVIAVLVTVVAALAYLTLEPILRLTGQAEEIIPLAGGYMRWTLPGVFPYFGFMVLREMLQAQGILRPLLVAIVAANLLNALVNWVLIFGHFGFPALGVTGAAVATTVSRWAMFLGLALLVRVHLVPRIRPWRAESWHWQPLRRMLMIGLPVGFQILFEYGVFGGVGLLMGRISAQALAGHQIALNMAAVAFMVPLGIGSAAAVMVGRAIGAGRPDDARRGAVAALIIGVSFMALTALVFVTFPVSLSGLYTNDAAVLTIAATLLPLAGLFQVFDGTQAVALGALRGAGDTRVPVLINLFGYYLIGLPVSLWLGFRQGLGPPGLWWGLVVGLMVVAVVLVVRVKIRLGRVLTRVVIDAPGH